MKKIRKTIITLLLMPSLAYSTKKPAVVIVPVAELVGEPFKITKSSNHDIEHLYENLPLCGGKNPAIACPRIHQLLFNEQVSIIKEAADQVQIEIPNLYFVTGNNKKPHNLYWTLKKNVRSLQECLQHTKDEACFPKPIDFSNPFTMHDPAIVTLKFPYFIPALNISFSAGTRFVLAQETKQAYQINIFDPIMHDVKKIELPKKICFTSQNYSPAQRIEEFVNLLRSWAHQTNGIIPYVWGGASFTHICMNDSFNEIAVQGTNKSTYYTRPNNEPIIRNGFDCTNLTSRAAQICGIPYFLKNSVTIKRELSPLVNNESINEGDLIWVPGHVMVVADLKRNTLIEARHYAHGYGKVQEIGLEKVFKNIKTFDDLRAAYQQKKSLERIDKDGAVRDIFKEFSIFPLAQVWTHRTTPKL